MRCILVVAVGLGVAAPAMAQNPFKIKGASRPVSVTYTLTGSMTGSAEYAATSDKFVRHEKSTGKFFGKTSTIETWSLMTPDMIYNADLVKHRGTKVPNMFPAMSKAYDQLSGSEKQRFAQNMRDMSQMLAQAFGAAGFAGESNGKTASYAGHDCVEHTYGAFSSCMMKDAPQIPLHESGSLFCVDYERTATAVNMGTVPPGAFDLPAGIEFREDTAVAAQSDSMARTMVRYLASQELADSLAAAKAKLQPQQQRQASNGASQADTASLQLSKADCEKLRDLDLGKLVATSFNEVVGEAVNEAVKEKEAEMKENAKSKIKGLNKKPKIF
jgi:hypothetical protein